MSSTAHPDAASPAPPSRSRAQKLLLATSLILIAFNLRPVFSSVSSVLPEIMADTGLSTLGASCLTAIPILCLGLFAPLAPGLARRFGIEKTLLGVIVLLGFGTLLRGAGSVPLLFAASGLAGAAIAVGNVLLPGMVKRDFAAQAGSMTGLYTMSVCAGASAAAGLTLPLANGLGHRWTWALAAWTVPVLLVVLLWAPQALRRSGAGTPQPLRHVRGLWRDPLAWQVTMFMGLQSALAYAALGWLAPILRERGVDGVTAGWVVSASMMVQVISCLVLPGFAIRRPTQSALNAALALTGAASALLLLYAPLSLMWLFALTLGLAQGGLFSVAMTLIVMRSPDSAVAAQLSSMAQTVGYAVAASATILVGLLHGIFNSFQNVGWVIAAIGLSGASFGWYAGRAAFVKTAAEPTP